MQVTTEQRDGVAVVTLDDGKVNAITAAALADIAAALEQAAEADAIVLAGRPGAFCAGFDRAVMTGDDAAARATLSRGGAGICAWLLGCPKPVVAASTGHAFTIGCLWLMACDTRIGERGDYRYAMTETLMGATLSGWPLALLEARVPPRLMTAIAVQSLVLGPDDAVEAGYLDRVVDSGGAVDAAVAAAKELAALPAAAYAANKRAVRAATLARVAEDLADG